ncbi:hypothetical protein V1509DRAFT_628632 [Lipomyces kononenkoae]
MSDPIASREFDELVSWVESHGGYCCPSLAFTKSERSGSTAYAKWPISKANTRLLSCPVSLIIDYDKAATHIWGDPQSCVFSGSPQIAIRLFLCIQRILGRQSQWAAYIGMLPTEFDTPLYYDHEELQVLQGTNIFGEAELRRQSWIEEWRRGVMYLPAKFDKSLVTWDLYMWACTVLSSRSFPSRIVFNTGPDENSYPVLIPLVDSLNHKPLEPINWNVTTDEFTISSGKSIETGDEVFNNYGPKGNEELLMGYGFCIENNPLDVVTLKLRHPPMGLQKQELVMSKGTRSSESIFYLSESESLPSDLVQFFRIIAANEHETRQMMLLPSSQSGTRQASSLRCELDGLGKLFNAVELKRRVITVPVEVANPSRRQRNSMIYVSQQAKILSQALFAIVQAMSVKLGIQAEEGATVKDARTKFYRQLPEHGFNLELVMNSAGRFSRFASVIKQGFDVTSASDVRAAEIEDLVLVLFVCHLLISRVGDYTNWLRSMQERYDTDAELDEDFVEDFESMYDSYIPALAELDPDMFGSDQWTARLLAWAGKVVDSEGVVVENCEDGPPEYWIIAVTPEL